MEYIELNVEQGSQEWLDIRKTHITGTDAAIILGKNPWKTPYKLWSQKMGLVEPDKVNSKMLAGQKYEPVARARFEELIGNAYPPTVNINPEEPWMMASTDGVSLSRLEMIEIKCSEKMFKSVDEGVIPDYYYPQVQHNLACTGAERCHFIGYWKGEIDYITVERDEDYISDMIEKERTFFFDHLAKNVPPPLLEKDYVVIEHKSFAMDVRNWKAANEALKKAKEDEKFFRDNLIGHADDNNVMGCGIKMTNVLRKGNVDTAKLYDAYKISSEELDKFRKPEVRSYRITQEKAIELPVSINAIDETVWTL